MIGLRNNPKALVFFISYKCNAQCKMCSAWTKKDKTTDLSLEEIKTIFKDSWLASNLKIINITGGEPTLRPDLTKIVEVIVDYCPKLKRIDIPTNGLDTERVVDEIEKILAVLTPTNINLSVTISLDGVGEIHNKIRGVSEGFDKVLATLREVKEFQRIYSNCSLSLNTTVSRYNYSHFEEIADLAKKEKIGFNITPAAVSEIGVESKTFEKNFSLNYEDKDIVIDILKKMADRKELNPEYVKFMAAWLKTGLRKGSCNFRRKKVVLLEPDGSIYLCGNFKEMYLGNLREKTFSQIWNNVKHLSPKVWRRCLSCGSNCYKDEKL